MRDIDHADISLSKGADNPENLLGFGLGQRRRRFVKNQQAGTLLDCATNFHHLLARWAELLHLPLRLEREVVFFDDARGACQHLATVHPAEGQTGLASEEYIF